MPELSAKVAMSRALRRAKAVYERQIARHRERYPLGSIVWYDRGGMVLETGWAIGHDDHQVTIRSA